MNIAQLTPQPTGYHILYITKFNNHTFGTNDDYFLIQHQLTGFITETKCLLRGTDCGFANNSGGSWSLNCVTNRRELAQTGY
jgi:hypothetical protein